MILKILIRSILLLLASFHPLAAIDFDQMISPSVVSQKKIEIPGYPRAFNGSIARWKNRYVLSFRDCDPANIFNSRIGLIFLDEAFNPAGEPFLLNTRLKRPDVPSRSEDARLIVIKERLYIVYNDNYHEDQMGRRSMYYSEVKYAEDKFDVVNPVELKDFENRSIEKTEKNWVPFEFQGGLLLAYSLEPHRILKPMKKSGHCTTLVTSSSKTPIDQVWRYGQLRGGTPAVKIPKTDRYEGGYLALFHSQTYLKADNAQERLDYYLMGGYLFALEPPFEILAVSAAPIIGPGFYHPHPSPYSPFPHRRSIYPCGLIYDEESLYVVCGREDSEIWVITLDLAIFINSLILL